MEYVIIGASAAGISAVESIRSVDPKGKITVISEENYPIYSRCLLSYYLAGDLSEEKLKYRPDDFFKRFDVNSIIGKKVTEVAKDKKLKLSDGSVVSFDKLLISTGSRSKQENIPGNGKEGVYGLRNIDDAKKIEERLGKTKLSVILGGGLIGLRSAYAMHRRGIKVTVIIRSPHVLSQILDAEGASLVQKRMEDEGIRIITGMAAKEITGNKEVAGITLENGEKIDCQLIIIGKGVQANIEIIKNTGMKTELGIIADDYLQSSMPDIYVAGDVAQAKDLVTGELSINALWPNAVLQGRIAGLNMAGKKQKYNGSLLMNSVEFFNLPTISCGLTKPKDKSFEVITAKNDKNTAYKRFVIKENKLVGFVLVNEVDNAGIYNSLIRKKIDIVSIKNKLLDKNFDFSKILRLIKQNKNDFSEREYQEFLV